MNVLVIPEDFRKDQYMLKPIIQALMVRVGKKTARVEVCQDPLLGGVDQAMNWDELKIIIEMYPMVDLFLLIVDRDGNANRRGRLDSLERKAGSILRGRRRFLAENAWQEIEVWVLAGHRIPSEWKWRDIRSEIHPKELYFVPFARKMGVIDEPFEGRKALAAAAVRNFTRMRSRCREDLENLELRLKNA